MKTSNKILLRDIKRLGVNVVSIVVLIGVSLLPSLYAWFNIAANMDPYGNLENIKIAIVNRDEPVEFEGQTIDVGGELVSELKSNNQLGWTFVDEDEALNGLRAGDYYSAIVIPEDFSSSFLSIVKGEQVEFPTMKYYVNEKLNAVAPKITEGGFNALQSQINSEFVSITSEMLAEKLIDESSELVLNGEEKKSTALDALAEAEWKMASYGDSLREMDDKLTRVEEMSGGLRKDVDRLRLLVDQGQITLDETRVLLENTRRESQKIMGMYEELLDDMSEMSRVAGSYSSGKYDTLSADLMRIQNGIALTLDDFQRVNALNGEIARALQDVTPVPEEMKPLNLLGQWNDINLRNDQLLRYLQSENQVVSSSMRDLDQSYSRIESDIKRASDGNKDLRRQFRRDIPPLFEQSFDLLNQTNAKFSGILSTMPAMFDSLDEVLREMDTLMAESHRTIGNSIESFENAQTRIGGLRTDLEQLSRGPLYEKISTLPDVDAKQYSTFMGDPVKIDRYPFYQVENNGSGMAPFFSNLAFWVGGMILVALFKLEVDEEGIGYITPRQAYMGKWKLFIFVGLLQAFAVAAGNIWFLHVQCEHPFYYIVTALLSSMTYMTIIFALTYVFRNIGKAIAVVVLILQIPGASGTYPIEMMAPFFKAIYPILPFRYGIDAMRETMFGMYGSHLIQNWLVLLIYIPIFLILGFYASNWLGSIGRTFDLKIAESELVVANYPDEKEPVDGDLMLALLRGDDEEIERIREKHLRFFRNYRKNKARAFLAVFVVPISLLVLMLNMEGKIVYLIIWICSIIAIALYQIQLELRQYRYRKAEELMEMSEAELLEYVKRKNNHDDDLESH